MAKKLRDEDLHLNIIVNGDKGKKELGDLEKSTRELTNRNKELRAEKDKLTRAGKQETEEYKAITREMKDNNRTIKANEARMTELRKEIGLTGLTMRQLRTEQTRLKRLMDSSTPGTPQWKQYRAELTKVEAQMRKVRTGGQMMGQSISSVTGSFTKFAAIGASVVATLTGIAFSVGTFVKGMVGLDDQLADVMKTTGLTQTQVRELYKDLETFNTRTPRRELLALAEEAGRLGFQSRQDIMDFVDVANQISVALGDDLGGESEVAIREVGKLTQIYKVGEQYGTDFKESMLKVGSAINEVSANSNAQAPFLIDYLKRMGGIAGQAKVTSGEILGYASALDQLGQKQEMAATAHGKIMVDMFKDHAKYAGIARMSSKDFYDLLQTDANEAFIKLLEGLNGNNEGFSVMAGKLDELGVDGARAVQVLSVLAANTKMVREQQALANKAMDEGISLTNEYNVKNNNLAASYQKISEYMRTRFINSSFLPWLEKVVGKVSEWTEVPLASTLREEQTELNLLISSITNANNTQETRNSLIAELQEAYPDFLANLDAEKATNEELRDRLSEVNEQYETRILMAIKEAALQENYKKRMDLKIEELDAIKQIAKYEEIAAQAREKAGAETDPNKLRSLLSDQEIAALNAMDLLPKKLENIRNQFTDLMDQENALNEAVKELRSSLTGIGTDSGGSDASVGSGGIEGGGGVSGVMNTAVLDALEKAYKERQLIIARQYETHELTDKEYKAKLWAAEMAYLEQKKALLLQMGKETIDIELQLVNQRIEMVNKTWDELKKKSDEFQKLFDKEMLLDDKQEDNQLTNAINESIKAGKKQLEEMRKNKDEEDKITKQRAQVYLDLASSVGDSFDDLLLSQEASFGQFLKNILVLGLDALEKTLVMSIAEATIKDVATKGPAGLATAMAKIVLMKAAFSTAKSVILGSGKKKGKKEGGFAEFGSDDEVDGFYHKNEWIASAPLVRIPVVRKFIDVFQYAQQTGNIHRLNMDTILGAVAGGMGGKKEGGFAQANGSFQDISVPAPQIATDPELKELLRQTLRVNSKLEATTEKLHREGTYTRLLGRDGLMETQKDYDRMRREVSL